MIASSLVGKEQFCVENSVQRPWHDERCTLWRSVLAGRAGARVPVRRRHASRQSPAAFTAMQCTPAPCHSQHPFPRLLHLCLGGPRRWGRGEYAGGTLSNYLYRIIRMTMQKLVHEDGSPGHYGAGGPLAP